MIKIGLKVKYEKNIAALLVFKKRLARELDYLEIGVRPGENYQLFKSLISGTDLFITIHGPIFEEGVNLAVPQKEKENKAGMKLAKEAADFFASPVIVLHPGDQETKEASLENLLKILKNDYDPRILLENTPLYIPQRPYRRIGAKISELALIKKKTRVGFCLDFGHALVESKIEKKEYYNYLKTMIKKLEPRYFHLSGCDGAQDRHWPIIDPKNVIDYQKIIPLLPQDSLLTLEVRPFDHEGNFTEAVFDDILCLKNLIHAVT